MHCELFVVIERPVPGLVLVRAFDFATDGTGTSPINVPGFACCFRIAVAVRPTDFLFDFVQDLICISLNILLVPGYAGSRIPLNQC